MNTRKDRITACLTKIDIRNLDPQEQDCSICLQSLLPKSTKIEGASIPETETAIRLQCGHVYGQDCISHWLDSHETCPQCRAVVLTDTENCDMGDWHMARLRERLRIIEDLEVTIMESAEMRPHAIRLRSFILRETSAQEAPGECLWDAIVYFSGHLTDVTNACFDDLINRCDEYLRGVHYLEPDRQRDIQGLICALAVDVAWYRYAGAPAQWFVWTSFNPQE